MEGSFGTTHIYSSQTLRKIILLSSFLSIHLFLTVLSCVFICLLYFKIFSVFLSIFLRVSLTMGVSAYWHGVDPGYYMSFLTVPPILMAERAMINAFRDEQPTTKQKIFDSLCWFFRMRGFDYNCMGFLLLSWKETMRYWASIYFLGHITIVVFYIVGHIFRPARKKSDWSLWLLLLFLYPSLPFHTPSTTCPSPLYMQKDIGY